MNSLAYINFMDKYKNTPKSEIFGDRKFLEGYIDDDDGIQDYESYEMRLSVWIGYYRRFPHEFVKDILGFELRDFQVYLLYSMLSKPNFLFSGARGLGRKNAVYVGNDIDYYCGIKRETPYKRTTRTEGGAKRHQGQRIDGEKI